MGDEKCLENQEKKVVLGFIILCSEVLIGEMYF